MEEIIKMMLKKIKTIFSWHNLPLFIFFVFCLFIFFRFTNLHLRIPFAWDQEQFSNQVKEIISDHKFTLLGPRVTNDRGFFLAPYFSYLLVPFYLLFNLDPNALILFIITVNFVFFTTTTFVLSRIFNMRYAMIFLLLWSINPLLIKYDTTPWWPVLIPIGVVIIWYLLFSIYKKPHNMFSWVLLGATVGFFSNMHFQFVFMAIYAGIFLIIHFSNKIIEQWKYILIGFVSCASMFLPLLVFDLRHDFLNSKLFMTFFTERVLDDLPYPIEWLRVLANALNPITGWNHPIMTILFLALFYIMLRYLIKRKKGYVQTMYKSTLILIITTAIGFSVYGIRPSEYYFVYLYPFIYVVLVDFFHIYKKYRFLPHFLFLYLVVINSVALKNSINADPNGLYYRKQFIKHIIPYAKDKKVNVTFDMPLGTNNGYIYLLEISGVHRTGDWNDPLIIIRVPPQEGDVVIRDIGLRIPPELK